MKLVSKVTEFSPETLDVVSKVMECEGVLRDLPGMLGLALSLRVVRRGSGCSVCLMVREDVLRWRW